MTASTDILKSPITFEGMKGVGNVTLDFMPNQRVYTLIGTNGIGKTKCLESLFQVLFYSSEAILEYFKKSGTILNFINFVKTNQFDIRDALSRYPANDFIKHQLPFVFLGSQNRGRIAEKQDTHNALLIGSFEERQKIYFNFLLTSMRQNFSSMNMDTDISSWFLMRAQSSNPYQQAKDNRKVEIDTVLQLLNKIDATISPDFMEISGDGRIFLEINGGKRALHELSSGYASILKIIQAIVAGYAFFTNEIQLQNVRGIVLVDEIESHLHTKWQSEIIPLLKEIFPNTTFYITTHSSIVLTQLSEGEAYRLIRNEEGVVMTEIIKRPDKAVFVDVLKDAFGLDVNALKQNRMSAESQKEAKARLLKFLSPEGDQL